MSERLRRIAEARTFQGFILAVIVLNAFVLGVQTYEIPAGLDSALLLADTVFLGIFTVEIAIRIAAFGSRPQRFFRDGWNVFDFLVVGAALVPGVHQSATLLRIVRLLRVVRLITVLPDLRILLRALVRSIPPIISLIVLTLMLMYVYGMIGWILFGEEDPGRWGDIGEALLSTFTMLTLENWPALLEAGLEIHPWSWVFFVSYVLLASFLVINILIAIIINSLEEVHAGERERERADEREREAAARAAAAEGTATVPERLAALRGAIDDLERELESEAEASGGSAPYRRPTRGGRMRG